MRRLELLLAVCLMTVALTVYSGSTLSQTGTSSPAGEATEDTATLELVFQGNADSAGLKKVQEAMNATAVPAINAKVELTRISHGTFNDQLNLILSSSEEVDLVNLYQLNTITLTNDETIRPLIQLLQGYDKETYRAISESDWERCYVDGEIVVVSSNKGKMFQICVPMDKAIYDELDIPYGTNATLDEIYDYLVRVKEACPDIYPLATGVGGSLHNHLGDDELGDNFGIIVDIYNDDLVVENLFISGLFINLCQQMWGQAQEGSIMPDGVSNTDTTNSLMAAGKAFARINTRRPGYENEHSMQIGREVVSSSSMEPFIMTDAVSTTYGWAIPHSSKHPEKTVQLLNMLYTNSELANIVCNGMGNEHWVYTDENKANIKYPDGRTSADVGYGRITHVQPNQQITIPWDGDPVGIWNQMDEFNRTAHASLMKGFVYDSDNILNEVTACMDARNKYWNGLLCGPMGPPVAISEMSTELEANGIDRIIAEKQRQLGEWAAGRDQ